MRQAGEHLPSDVGFETLQVSAFRFVHGDEALLVNFPQLTKAKPVVINVSVDVCGQALHSRDDFALEFLFRGMAVDDGIVRLKRSRDGGDHQVRAYFSLKWSV